MYRLMRWIYNLGYKQGFKDAELIERRQEFWERKIGYEPDVGEEIKAIDEAMRREGKK